MTRDAQDSANFSKYEQCVSKDSLSENCLKCRKKKLETDLDRVYQFCSLCHFECISNSIFQKTLVAQSLVTQCWASGESLLNTANASIFDAKNLTFTYRDFSSCNATNCMTPIEAEKDSFIYHINQQYL